MISLNLFTVHNSECIENERQASIFHNPGLEALEISELLDSL